MTTNKSAALVLTGALATRRAPVALFLYVIAALSFGTSSAFAQCAFEPAIQPNDQVVGRLSDGDCTVEQITPFEDDSFIDLYPITLPRDGRLTVQMASPMIGAAAIVNPTVLLLDTNLSFPPITGDSTGERRPVMFAVNLSAGTYVIGANSNDRETGTYTLTTTGPEAGPPGDSDVSATFNTAIDDNWQSIPIPPGVVNPVVIAGPPTLHGPDPGVVRLRNVSGNSFEVRFQEWDYLDGLHGQEAVSFSVLEPTRAQLADGTIAEVGTFSLGGTGVWQRQAFSQAFPGTPAVFLTVQSANGASAVTARVRNVDTAGFGAALFEEEALMDGHAAETVGYLAVFSPQGSGTVDVEGTQAPYALQSVSLDYRLRPVLSSVVQLEEERSADAEVVHGDERVDVLALGDTVFAQVVSHVGGDTVALRRIAPEHGALMEWGVVEHVTHQWTTVPLAKDYTNPVVVAKPVSNVGLDPGVIRLRNVTGDSFELRYQEWTYLDDLHGAQERVFYLVAEAGSRVLAGLRVEAGILDSATLLPGSEVVSFSTSFAARPALFTSVQSLLGADPVTTRIVSASASDFELAMQEEEAKTDGHTAERLGWIAIALGGGATNDGRRVLVFEDAVDDVSTVVSYGETLNRRFPLVISDMASTLGGDPGFLRYQNPGPSTIELFIDEEQSLDLETTHTFEDVSVFVAE